MRLYFLRRFAFYFFFTLIAFDARAALTLF